MAAKPTVSIRVEGLSAEFVDGPELLTSGLVGAQAYFQFDETWDGFDKTAVFRAGEVVRDAVILDDGTAVIPAECLQTGIERLDAGVYGVGEDGATVRATIWARGPVICTGVDPTGDPGADPELPIWSQLIAMIGDLDDLTTETKASLVEAINELADGFPETLPNPSALTVYGEDWAVKYDGSYALEVDLSGYAESEDVVAKAQGTENAGKYLAVGADGNVTLTDAPAGTDSEETDTDDVSSSGESAAASWELISEIAVSENTEQLLQTFDKGYSRLKLYFSGVAASTAGALTVLGNTGGNPDFEDTTTFLCNVEGVLDAGTDRYLTMEIAADMQGVVCDYAVHTSGQTDTEMRQWANKPWGTASESFRDGFTDICIGSVTDGLALTGGEIVVTGIPA